MEILPKQTSLFGEEELTSLQADSHANHIALQDKGKVKKMNATSGRKCLELLERLPRATSWGKTFMGLLIGTGDWFSTRCKLTWKVKATKYNQLYCQLVPLVRHIGVKEFGLCPTPTSVQRDHPERVQGLLDKGATTMMSRKNGENKPNSILDAAMFYGLIPTPATRDYKGARTKEALKKAGRNETNSLPDYFSQDGMSSQLRPQFTAEMMGFPSNWTELPFLSGERFVYVPCKPLTIKLRH